MMFTRQWGAPPAGGDHNKGTAIEVVSWVFTSIAFITVTLRLYGRLGLTRNPVKLITRVHKTIC